MPKSSAPWRMALPAIGLLALAAAWSGYWYWTFTQSRAAVAEWRQEQAANGVQTECVNESWSGYPFRVEVTCAPARIKHHDSTLTLTKLTVLAQAYQLRHILAVNDGETIFTTPEREVRLAHEGAIASIIIGKHGEAQADAEFTTVTAEGFRAQSIGLHLWQTRDQLDVAAELQSAQAQLLTGEPVAIDSAILLANATPVPPSLDLRALAESGSVFHVTSAEIKSAEIRFTGEGKLAIGADGIPQGKLKGRIQNFDHVLEALAQRRILSDEQRMGAGAVLGLLGGNAPDGIKIEIAARDGGLWLGPFRLGKLAPLF